jgi:hypothetical protein
VTKPTTQETRLLAALERAGKHGLTSADFSGVHGTPDGLGPMPRFARALHNLRHRDGYDIEDVKDANGEQMKRHGCNVVRLVEAPMLLDEGVEPAARLFQPAPGNAIIGEEAA